MRSLDQFLISRLSGQWAVLSSIFLDFRGINASIIDICVLLFTVISFNFCESRAMLPGLSSFMVITDVLTQQFSLMCVVPSLRPFFLVFLFLYRPLAAGVLVSDDHFVMIVWSPVSVEYPLLFRLPLYSRGTVFELSFQFSYIWISLDILDLAFRCFGF